MYKTQGRGEMPRTETTETLNRTMQIETITRLTPDSGKREQTRAAPMVPSLTVLTGPGFGEMLTLGPHDVLLGRSSECDLRFDDASISRRHVRLRHRDGLYLVEDLGSSNGTLHNGEPLDGLRPLREGDKLTLGNMTVVRFARQDAQDQAFQRRLYDAALRDGLTGAYNKRYLTERLHMEMAFCRRHGTNLCAVLLDVDHFKQINDTWGHLAGDTVLRDLVTRFQSLVRVEDVLARYGGEEFAVLCRGIDAAGGRVVAERLRTTIEARPFEHAQVTIAATISLGVAAVPQLDARTGDALLAAADRALYAAKRGGRNRVVVAG